MWTPQEPVRPRHFCGNEPSVDAATRSPVGEVHPPTPSSKRVQLQYRQAKETKRGGTSAEESERAMVPTKAGNRTAGTRQREGLAVAWNRCEDR